MRFVVVKVEPTGEQTRPAFVTRRHPDGSRCSYEDITTPTYPPHPNGDRLRELRREGSVSLREAAALLDLTAEQVSGLEFGRYTFADGEDDWARALEMVAAISRPDRA